MLGTANAAQKFRSPIALLRGQSFQIIIYPLFKVRSRYECMAYWAIQAVLLTPLTFARHRLSPLAAFTSGAYYLHSGRQ